MEKVTALEIRQRFGGVLKKLQKKDEPILIEKGREPVAVLISLKTFNNRFIDFREKEKRDELVRLARASATKSPLDSLTVIRELRYGPRR